MELQITQEKLDFAFMNVSRVASSRSSLPILNNILLRTEKDQLIIAATNLEIASTHKLQAKILKQGSITIPAKLISDFVHNLPKETIHLHVKNNQLHIQSGGYSSIINGVQDDDFPELPQIDTKNAISYIITNQDFKQAVNQTIIAASSDSTRPVLTGVYWHSQDGFLYCAATDGYRLAERKLLETTSQIRAIIPTTTLQEVLRTLRDENEEIHVLFDETQVTFLMENIEITSRLIDGKFPDYRQLIPNESETSCTIKSNDFNRITKVAGLFARESGGGIILHINADKSTVSVQSIASEIGENNSELPVETQGVGGTVSLNSKYLTDALSVIDAQNISFGFSGKLAPCVLQKASKSTNYKHIIMPLKS